MTRLILRILNAPSLILFTLLGMALQTSLFSIWYFQYFQPDVIVWVIVWCALRRKFFEGGVLTLLIADAAEIHSASPQGAFLISYMLIFLFVKYSARVFVLGDFSSLGLITLVSAALAKIFSLGVLYLLGVSTVPWQHHLLLLFPQTAMSALLGNWVYRWLERFDWVTFKNPRAVQALEDELQLEVPGSG